MFLGSRLLERLLWLTSVPFQNASKLANDP